MNNTVNVGNFDPYSLVVDGVFDSATAFAMLEGAIVTPNVPPPSPTPSTAVPINWEIQPVTDMDLFSSVRCSPSVTPNEYAFKRLATKAASAAGPLRSYLNQWHYGDYDTVEELYASVRGVPTEVTDVLDEAAKADNFYKEFTMQNPEEKDEYAPLHHEVSYIVETWAEHASSIVVDHVLSLRKVLNRDPGVPIRYVSIGTMITEKLAKVLTAINCKQARTTDEYVDLAIVGCPREMTDLAAKAGSMLYLTLSEIPVEALRRVSVTDTLTQGQFFFRQGKTSCLSLLKQKHDIALHHGSKIAREYYVRPFFPYLPRFRLWKDSKGGGPEIANPYSRAFFIGAYLPFMAATIGSYSHKSAPEMQPAKREIRLPNSVPEHCQPRYVGRKAEDDVCMFKMAASEHSIDIEIFTSRSTYTASVLRQRKVPRGTKYFGWAIVRGDRLVNPLISSSGHQQIEASVHSFPYFADRMFRLLGGVTFEKWEEHPPASKSYWVVPFFGATSLQVNANVKEMFVAAPYAKSTIVRETTYYSIPRMDRVNWPVFESMIMGQQRPP